jgi:hypothetical protein
MTELERLSIIEALRDLKARYCRLADEKRWHELAALFTEDASMCFFDANGEIFAKTHGRADFASTVEKAVATGRAIHHVYMGEFEIISTTEARAVWAMEDRIFQPEGSGMPYSIMHGYGHYHEAYRKVADSWLISNLRQTRLKLDFK